MRQTDRISPEDRAWLNSIYSLAFPTLIRIVRCTDIEMQKKGVDWFIYLRSGKRIRIEDKIRFGVYSDILLEEYSNYEARSVGWALDNGKITDYLFYTMLHSKHVWAFWFPALRVYFQEHLEEWREKYGWKEGKTKDEVGRILYTTKNIPVPLIEFPSDWAARNLREYRHGKQ